jgi:hypothetical protein
MEEDAITHEEAKEEYEQLFDLFQEFKEAYPALFKWQYKKGREVDVLAYIMLDETERRKLAH